MLKNEDYLKIFHEVKNSITLVSSSLQLVEKNHPEVIGFDDWGEMMSEIDFLKNMVSQLSSIRLCSRSGLMQVNIYSFMHQVARSVRALSLTDFTCNFHLDDGLPLIELNPQLLKQALINLIKNAYEAANAASTVTVHTFCKDRRMQIAVTDHAGGLDPAIENTILQPFITTKTGGSGLGLSITKQIAEYHHGTLTYISRPGDGCTFTLSIPLTQS